MRRRLAAFVGFLSLFLSGPAFPQQPTMSTPDAKGYVGQRATVCGIVVDSRFAIRTRGQPTFLNLDKPYPNQVFTIVIWGSDRAKFDQPEVRLRKRKICVTGTIETYRNLPQIVATEPSQIRLQDDGSHR